MITKDQFKPCPHCGSTNFKIRYMHNGDYVEQGASSATICCKNCMARMSAEYKAPNFEKVGNDLYRKSPERFAEEVLLDKWNARWTPQSVKKQKKSNRCFNRLKNLFQAWKSDLFTDY